MIERTRREAENQDVLKAELRSLVTSQMGCNCIPWRLRKGNHELKVNPDYTVGTHPHGVRGRDERQERRKREEGGRRRDRVQGDQRHPGMERGNGEG